MTNSKISNLDNFNFGSQQNFFFKYFDIHPEFKSIFIQDFNNMISRVPENSDLSFSDWQGAFSDSFLNKAIGIYFCHIQNHLDMYSSDNSEV